MIWLVIYRSCPVLQENVVFEYEGVFRVKGSCFWITRICKTCLKTLLKLNISDMCVLDFWHNDLVLKQKVRVDNARVVLVCNLAAQSG